MKKVLVFFIIVLLLSLGGMITAFASAEAPRGYEQIAVTDELELFFNESTAAIAVLHVASGQFWFSNPRGIALDELARGVNRYRLMSQIELFYATRWGVVGHYNSYEFSVSNGTFRHELTENGIQVFYDFSDIRRDITFIPPYISQERFRGRILDQITDRDDRTRIRGLFSFNEGMNAYVRTNSQQSELIMRRIFDILEGIGYTDEEMQYDRDMFDTEEGVGARRPRFYNIGISYEIIGDMFYATLHTEDIIEQEGFYITNISFLEFFGAADWESEGYIFVPDGSGALIYLNNERSFTQPFSMPVYGRDQAHVLTEDIMQSQTVRLPVFGIYKNDHSFVAIIENGAALANINADVAGRTNSFNSVFASFTIRVSEVLQLTDGQTVRTSNMFQRERFSDSIRIAYHFLHGDDADFVGMANFYRSYLASRYDLQPIEHEDIPFYLEFVGGFERRTSFLGIPITRFTALTTFEQAQDITESFADSGIKNINVIMNGWFNRGIRHSAPTSINVPRRMGGRSGLTTFNEYLVDNEIGFYPVVNFMTNQRPTLGYNNRRMSSRQINQRPSYGFTTYVPTYLEDNLFRRFSIISPRNILNIMFRFLDRFSSLNITGLAPLDVGDYLHSDFYQRDMVNREDALHIMLEGLGELYSNHDIIVSGGNAPTIRYASHIINTPFSHSGFNITNRGVPFMQIALRGYVDFAGEPINLWDVRNLETAFLRILELNSGVYFKLTHERSDLTIRTEFERLFSTHYVTWFDTAVDIYTRANYQLRDVRNAAIVSHELLAPGVVRVGYDNGISFTINYNLTPVDVEGREILALDFIREDS